MGPVNGATLVTVGGATYVYVSAAEIALVPPAVVTVMSTLPAEPAGRSCTLICVSPTTVKHGGVGDPVHGVVVISTPPTNTLVAATPDGSNPVPMTLTVFPPTSGPNDGVRPVTAGADAYTYWSAVDVALGPTGVCTVMSTVPAVLAGRSWIVIWASVFTVKHGDTGDGGQGEELTSWVPTKTSVAPVNPVPATTTVLPPAGGPAPGVTFVTVGRTAYVY